MIKIRKVGKTKHWWAVSFLAAGCKMAQALWKTYWQVITKLNAFLPCDPAIILCGTYPNELKIYVYTKIFTMTFQRTLYKFLEE